MPEVEVTTPPTTVPPAPESSPIVRGISQVREGLTDLAVVAALLYLGVLRLAPGNYVVLALLAVALPSTILRQIAKIFATRVGGGRAATALLAASVGYGKIKLGGVAVGTAAVLAACISGCAGGSPHVTAVAPRIVQRTEYGTCLEVGGKVRMPGHGVLTQLSSTCWEREMDASVEEEADAGPSEFEGPIEPKDGGGL